MKAVLLAGFLSVASASALAGGYSITVLPQEVESPNLSAGRDLANDGAVLLSQSIYRNGALIPLGPTGGRNDYPTSVNSSGVVVGQSETGAFTPYGYPTSSFQWTSGAATLLPVSGWSTMVHIADDGTMLGRRFVRDNGASLWKPFVIRNGVESVLPLGTGYFPSGSVTSVNASGTIVGSSSTNNGPYYYRAAMWTNGTFQDLGTSSASLPFSEAQKVLNDGRVWVRSSTDPYQGNATTNDSFWKNGVWTSLTALGGYTTHVVDVNNSGTILGVATDFGGARHSFLYDDAEGFRLLDSVFASTPYINAFVSGHQPVAINDAGQLLFAGNYRDPNFNLVVHDLLLTPSAVPEPATLACLGLGALALLRRRRRPSAE